MPSAGLPGLPITVCGSRDAVITGAGNRALRPYIFHVKESSFIRLIGVTLTNGFKGGQASAILDRSSKDNLMETSCTRIWLHEGILQQTVIQPAFQLLDGPIVACSRASPAHSACTPPFLTPHHFLPAAGVVLDYSTDCLVKGVRVYDMGYEAIRIRSFSSNNIVQVLKGGRQEQNVESEKCRC